MDKFLYSLCTLIYPVLIKSGLKGLSHQIFKAFFMTCNIKSVLSACALMVFKFFYLVVVF
jgi:hypothetical protein